MKLFISGSATTKFGERWEVSPRSLAKEAVENALHDADIDHSTVDALFVGNMLSGMLGGQEHLGAFFSEAVGLSVPAVKIEGACASGGLAVHQGVMSVLSGLYKTVVVLGVEKMTDHKPDDVATALMGAGSDRERLSGATFPGLYAIMARMHMMKYKTTEEQLARIVVKNHYHASLNPNAQFHNILTIEQVMKSPSVADPLKLLDCSPITDGAAAIVITSQPSKKHTIEIIASSLATDTLGLSERSSLVELEATRKAAHRAYSMAGVTAKDISIAEVHDCFSIAEVLAMEDLGFFEKGKTAKHLEQEETTIGKAKQVVINPSGGLKGCGHPVGATGVKQLVELTDQLRGNAGKRQVKHNNIALAHNVGGSGATAVVHILKYS